MRYAFAPAALLLAACSAPSRQEAANDVANGAASATTADPEATGDEAASVDEQPGLTDHRNYQMIIHEVGMLVATPGHGVPLKFEETSQEEVERALRDFGAPKRSDGPADCPAGKLNFLDYPNGIQLAFQDGKFVGYWADRKVEGVETAEGLKPGLPSSALGNAKVEETSFGKIALVDNVPIALSEDGKSIEAIYAGLACIYD